MGVVEAGIALGLVSLSYERTRLLFLPVPDTKWYPYIWGALSLAALVLLIFGKRPRPAGGVPSQRDKSVTCVRWFILGCLVLVIAMRVYVTLTIAPLMREIHRIMLP